MKVILPCVIAVTLAIAAYAAEMVDVMLYEAPRSAPPTLDGHLSDPCWRAAPEFPILFEYWSPSPGPAPVRTHLQLCYDQRALYLGVTLNDEHLDKARASVTGRDVATTWHDDCIEFMLDPHNTGNSYFKFTTNLLAARYDERLSPAGHDSGWNGEGWRVATSRGDKVWFIELALPWADLGVSAPNEGDIWSFTVVRYAWGTGKFQGAAWAPGGNYARPGLFGYLAFTRVADANRLAQLIAQTKGPNTRIVTTSGIAGVPDLRAWCDAALARVAEILTQASESKPKAAVQQKLDELRARLRAAAPLNGGLALEIHRATEPLAREATELKWDTALQNLIRANQ
jgi:hypothetical protein